MADTYEHLRASFDRALEKTPERRALRFAVAALREVGDDYPGSSCQKWCHDKAAEALRIAGVADVGGPQSSAGESR